jgi:hypothetical protein
MTEPDYRGQPDAGPSRSGFTCLLLAFVLSITMGLGGLIVVAAFILPASCACAASADPNWTPPPTTAEQAAVYAAKIAGLPSMSVDRSVGPDGRTIWLATAPNAVAFVDAISGTVIEVVLEDRMPVDARVSVSGSEALADAQLFVGWNQGDTGLVASYRAINQAGVAAYLVTWSDAAGVARVRAEVNASTGDVFAYADLRPQIEVSLPLIGRARATELAIAALGIPGETVTSAELSIDISASPQTSTWGVGLGVPTATQADVFEKGAYVQVDALTGETTIVKS